jgi:hypothetical protein
MEFPVSDGVEVYQRACELAGVLRQHVFDTLRGLQVVIVWRLRAVAEPDHAVGGEPVDLLA